MRIELEDGETLEIATNHGVILINSEMDTGTLITAMANDGHKLVLKTAKSEAGKPIVNVWAVPTLNQNL